MERKWFSGDRPRAAWLPGYWLFPWQQALDATGPGSPPPLVDSLWLHYFPTTLFLSFYLYSRPIFESRHHNGLSRWAAILQLTSCPHFSMKHMRKRKATPDGQDRAWYPQLCLGVLLQNINVFKDCGHQRCPLYDRDGSRHKQDRSVTCLNHKIPTGLSPSQLWHQPCSNFPS